MSSLNHDSYTGDEYKAPYVSKIPGIHLGRSPFYKDAELRRISAQYFTEPHAEGVRVRRADCPPHFFPVLASLAQAVAAMDWCVRNDGSVGVAIHWLNKKEIEPYLNLLTAFVEAGNAAAELGSRA